MTNTLKDIVYSVRMSPVSLGAVKAHWYIQETFRKVNTSINVGEIEVDIYPFETVEEFAQYVYYVCTEFDVDYNEIVSIVKSDYADELAHVNVRIGRITR